MADFVRYCGECFKPVPPEWTPRYCPSCGSGRIKLRIVRRRDPSKAKPPKPRERSEKRENAAPKLKITRKCSGRDKKRSFAFGEKSALGPRFVSSSPAVLFILNILTLGLRGTSRMLYHMPSFVMMAKMEEKKIKGAVNVWLFSYAAALALALLNMLYCIAFGLSAFDFFRSRVALAAFAAFCLSFLIGRFVLLWSREAVIDGLLTHGNDVVKSRAPSFAPSMFLMWFAGTAYMQFHINRMIKRGGLLSFSSSRGKRKKTAPKPPKQEPD